LKETIITLFNFQLLYLKKIIRNIPEERLYERQLYGFNSAGWLLGHICVEAEDVFIHLNISYSKLEPNWSIWFKNSTGDIKSLNDLPTKDQLLSKLEERYALLSSVYLNLSDDERLTKHPSEMLKKVFPNLDSWFAHHLTTHIAIHCGNIVVWKKMIGLDADGF
jgi:uncharacterized damage-inducible protein DinB